MILIDKIPFVINEEISIIRMNKKRDLLFIRKANPSSFIFKCNEDLNTHAALR